MPLAMRSAFDQAPLKQGIQVVFGQYGAAANQITAVDAAYRWIEMRLRRAGDASGASGGDAFEWRCAAPQAAGEAGAMTAARGPQATA